MSVAGTGLVLSELEKVTAQIQLKADAAMREIAFALEGWAKIEHGHEGGPIGGATANFAGSGKRNPPHNPPFWKLSGDTDASIEGQIERTSADLVSAYLSAGMDYDVFLELAKDGKWAFLWPTLQNHKDDILKILEARLNL